MALSDKALTTVARMESELSITSASSTLEPLIEEASEEIQQTAGRWFYRNSGHAESVPGYGGRYLRVSDHLPIVSVSAITYDGDTVNSSTYDIHDSEAGEIVSDGTWSWTATESTDITRDPIVGTEEALYEVTYTGGWITPKQDDDGVGSRNLPYDIERACIDLVKALYYQRTIDPSVQSKKVSKGSVTYSGGSGAMSHLPPRTRQVIQRYQRPAVA